MVSFERRLDLVEHVAELLVPPMDHRLGPIRPALDRHLVPRHPALRALVRARSLRCADWKRHISVGLHL